MHTSTIMKQFHRWKSTSVRLWRMAKGQLNKQIVSSLLGYFMKGLLLVVPLLVTIYIISLGLHWIDGLIGPNIPGMGMSLLFLSVTLFGYLGSSLLMKSVFTRTEGVITKLPLINIIYSSLKEVTEAFVGRKEKFSQPVLVIMDPKVGMYRIGFVTQKDLKQINLLDHVAVYMPDSYNFSGRLCIVAQKSVIPLNISTTEAMKFVLSGGVTGLHHG